MNKKICVLGAGSWGTALAIILYKKGHQVSLWEFDKIQAKLLSEKRFLSFLPELAIPKDVLITSDLNLASKGAQIFIFAVPSQVMRDVVRKAAKVKKTEKYIAVSVAKGFEIKTTKRMSEVLKEELTSDPFIQDIAVLSGPSHAEEVSKGIPTTVVIACKNKKITKFLQTVFTSASFRVYTSTDVIGVEIGAALKNIIAIACGISDGLGLGDNTKAALITRGLVEIRRMGIKMGANPVTFSGLSGMGDLIVTCISKHSRNRNFGEKIGQGKSFKNALKEIVMVAEGVYATKAAHKLMKKNNLSLPITEEVYNVLFKGKAPKNAMKKLLERKPKDEID